ncbi:MAG: CsgG/HfaB family protein [Nitrospira sp.]
MRTSIAAIALVLSLFVASCGTLDSKTILLNVGDSKARVLEVMGPPKDRQIHGQQEAWQYCVSGAGFGWNDHKIIWLNAGRVTGINSYRSGVTGCSGGIEPIRWGSAPAFDQPAQAPATGQTIRPDVMASGPLTGAMLDKYNIIAVLPFADAPHAPSSGSTVNDIVSTQLLDLEFAVVERTRLQQLFEEQRLQLRSADEQATAIRIGRLAGAKVVVTGTVQQWETQKDKGTEKSFVSLSFRLVDVETGAILFSGQGQFREPISAAPQMMAGIITDAIFDRMAIQTGIRMSGRIGFQEDYIDRFGNKTVRVKAIKPGFPAEKAGLQAGDVILSCNGSSSTTWTRKRDSMRACSVEAGQDLVLEVARGEQRQTIRATAVSRE